MARDRRVHSNWLRGLAAASSVLSVLTAAAPAGAVTSLTSATAAVTRIGATAAPTTVRVGSALVVSGSVTPKVAGVPVVLQRLVGRRWVSIRSGPVNAAGRFSLSVRSAAPAAIWQLRVARIASKGVRAGAGSTLAVRLTNTSFTVRAAATPAAVIATSPAVVTGTATPRAAGAARLQRLQGATWRDIATVRLSSASGFRFSVVLPVGSHQLRVVRPLTATVATGASPPLRLTVSRPATPPPPPLTVTSTVLPRAVAGRAFSATLTASGASGPYVWTVNGSLPTGLALTSDGRLWGYPTTAGQTAVQIVARTSAGSMGAATVTITTERAPSGTAWAWGYNDIGQLGFGTYTPGSSVPSAVKGLARVTAVAAFSGTAYALLSDGTVWAWGEGMLGQLGNGKAYNYATPVRVSSLTDVTAIAAGGSTGYALRSDGTVWAWGNNSMGQLGDGLVNKVSYHPLQVSSLTGIVAIAGGGFSGHALKADGTVWSWGDNQYGQLGIDSAVTNSHLPLQVKALTGITAMAGGFLGAYALRADGTVWSWGDNNSGQLGIGPTTVKSSSSPVQVSDLTGVTAIAAGWDHGYARLADGTVRAWGVNTKGEVGNGTTAAALVPVQVSGLTGIAAISSGRSSGYAIGSDGKLRAWGDNGGGKLGNGTVIGALVPVVVGAAGGLTGVVAVAGSGAAGYAVKQVVEVI